VSLLAPEWTALLYLVSAVCFILALKGLSSPRSARRGNLIGAFGALLAVITVFFSVHLENLPWILGAIAVGSLIAVPIARRVQMTQMPQLVGGFNGVGGGAAALVAVLELGHNDDPWVRLAIVFTMLVGAVSFSGSAVTVAKLQELISTRPLMFPGMRWVMTIVLLAAVYPWVARMFPS
jgi:NAD(P) transhydrogenase subunit beta